MYMKMYMFSYFVLVQVHVRVQDVNVDVSSKYMFKYKLNISTNMLCMPANFDTNILYVSFSLSKERFRNNKHTLFRCNLNSFTKQFCLVQIHYKLFLCLFKYTCLQ